MILLSNIFVLLPTLASVLVCAAQREGEDASPLRLTPRDDPKIEVSRVRSSRVAGYHFRMLMVFPLPCHTLRTVRTS